MKKGILISCAFFGGISLALASYSIFFSPNTYASNKRFELTEKTSCEQLLKKIKKEKIIKNSLSFKIASLFFRKRFAKQGSYKIDENISNFKLLNKLTKGEQDPVDVTIGNFETINELAKYLDTHLLFSGKEFLDFCLDENFLKKYKVNKYTVITLFLPNTYQFYWNVSVKKFFERMVAEFNNFWTKEKKDKAQAIKLNPNEVIILASMVEKEIAKQDEASRIAGVFVNRLKKKMRLQSDPTIFYARKYDPQVGDNNTTMLGTKSKYSTYRYGGLPIGAICIPSLQTINAVLNYEKHDFLFFVTAPDRIHHLFSQTFAHHKKNIYYTFKKHKTTK